MLENILLKYDNPKINFLSGWGQKSDNILNFPYQIDNIDYLSYNSIDKFFHKLKLQNPQIIIGWSLGGQIAINAILQNIINPKLLILLSTSFQFLSQNSYKIGVDGKIYDNFCDNLSNNPEKLLKKFHLMMLQGDKRFPELKNQYIYSKNFDNLQYWLDYLVNFSAFDLNFDNFCPTELIYGKNDQIVNYKQAHLFHEKIKNSNLSILEKYSHLPFCL